MQARLEVVAYLNGKSVSTRLQMSCYVKLCREAGVLAVSQALAVYPAIECIIHPFKSQEYPVRFSKTCPHDDSKAPHSLHATGVTSDQKR